MLLLFVVWLLTMPSLPYTAAQLAFQSCQCKSECCKQAYSLPVHSRWRCLCDPDLCLIARSLPQWQPQMHTICQCIMTTAITKHSTSARKVCWCQQLQHSRQANYVCKKGMTVSASTAHSNTIPLFTSVFLQPTEAQQTTSKTVKQKTQ